MAKVLHVKASILFLLLVQPILVPCADAQGKNNRYRRDYIGENSTSSNDSRGKNYLYTCRKNLHYKMQPSYEGAKIEPIVLEPVVVEKSAFSEELARSLIEDATINVNGELMELCQRKHMSVSRCIATKLQGIRASLRLATEDTRKVLEKAVADDCLQQRGICLGVVAGEVQCKAKKRAIKNALNVKGSPNGNSLRGKKKVRKR